MSQRSKQWCRVSERTQVSNVSELDSQVVKYYDAIDTKEDEESDGRMDYKYLLSDLGIGEFVSSCHTGPQDFLRDFGPEDFAEVQQDTAEASRRHGFSARGPPQ